MNIVFIVELKFNCYSPPLLHLNIPHKHTEPIIQFQSFYLHSNWLSPWHFYWVHIVQQRCGSLTSRSLIRLFKVKGDKIEVKWRFVCERGLREVNIQSYKTYPPLITKYKADGWRLNAVSHDIYGHFWDIHYFWAFNFVLLRTINHIARKIHSRVLMAKSTLVGGVVGIYRASYIVKFVHYLQRRKQRIWQRLRGPRAADANWTHLLEEIHIFCTVTVKRV